MFPDLEKATPVGSGLFELHNDSRAGPQAHRGRAHARFGREAVRFGRTSKPRTWRLRRDRLSPRYTTYRDELLRLSHRGDGHLARGIAVA